MDFQGRSSRSGFDLLRCIGIPLDAAKRLAPLVASISRHQARSTTTDTSVVGHSTDVCHQQCRVVSSGATTRCSMVAWASNVFHIFQHLHTVIIVLDEAARVGSDVYGRIPISLAKSELGHLRNHVMPLLTKHCLTHLLTLYLDQTFPLAAVRATVDCLCQGDYYLCATADINASENAATGNANDEPRSNPALLLIRLIHAIISATCRERSAMDLVTSSPGTSPLPEWMRCTWAAHSHAITAYVPRDDHDHGARGDAITFSPRHAPTGAATVVEHHPRNAAAAKSRDRRRITLDRIDGEETVTNQQDAPCPGNGRKRPRRSGGLVPLPCEVQLLVLHFLPPRHIVTAEAVCYLWKCLVSSSCEARRALNASRVVRNVYHSFLVDDWGEKYLALRAWSFIVDFEALLKERRDSEAVSRAAVAPDLQSRLDVERIRMREVFSLMLHVWVVRAGGLLQRDRTCASAPPLLHLIEADKNCVWVVASSRMLCAAHQTIVASASQRVGGSVVSPHNFAEHVDVEHVVANIAWLRSIIAERLS